MSLSRTTKTPMLQGPGVFITKIGDTYIHTNLPQPTSTDIKDWSDDNLAKLN